MYIQHIYIPSVDTNCYLFADESSGAAAVIDPGDDITAALLRFAADHALTLRAVFLTHGHYDHVGGVTALRQTLPALPVYLHPGDANRTSPLSPTAALGEVTLWHGGDVLPLGSLRVEVLHTPGHTPGSVALRCRDALFTGDTLFAGSRGRTDFPGGSPKQMVDSLRRLGSLEGNCRIFPGHGPFSTLDRERESNRCLKAAMKGNGL